MFNLNTLPILKNRKNRQYLEVGIVVSWSLFLLWFGLISSVSAARKASEQTKQAQDIASKLDSKLDAIQKAKGLMDENSALALLIEDSVPSSPKAVTFVNSMSLLVNNSNLVLTRLDYQGASAKEGKEKDALPLGFSLSAKGKYEDIETLVARLERLPRIINLSSIGIDGGQRITGTEEEESEGQNNPELRVDITGVFFYRNE